MRLLLIEDDRPLAEALATGLRAEGFAVDRFETLRDATSAVRTTPFDALILDRGLPDGDSLDLLTRLRTDHSDTPVVFLTARDALEDRLAGLDAGADDYLVKPVALPELVARIRAVTRRRHGRPQPVWTQGALRLDPAARVVTWRDRAVELTAREFALLELLFRHAGQALSRDRIEESLYDWSSEVGSNTIEVYVHQLRRKIDPAVVRTLRGVGYALGSAEALA